MVNEVRTLLLNVDGASRPEPDYPGEEYVPPDFRSRALPGYLARVRASLFGSDPDRATLNWRLRELTTCIHATGMGRFATDLDPRLTYLPVGLDLMTLVRRGAVARRVAGTQELQFQGSPDAVTGTSRIYLRWRVDALSATSVRVTGRGDSGPTEQTLTTFAVSGGLSEAVPLPGSNLGFRLTSGDNGSWEVSVLCRPWQPLGDAVRAAEGSLAGDDADALFGTGAAEPYAAFRATWEGHDQFPYRAAALALAAAYRTRELPTATGV